MPTHYGNSKPRKSGMAKAPKGKHRMPDGSIMDGEKHGDKPTGVAKSGKAKPKAKSGGKGSSAMKEKMAKLRAMRGKKKK